MARVQVDPLGKVQGLRTTASPVDVYVRPAAQPTQQSELSQFVNALIPAATQIAQAEKEKEVKRQLEIEEGIKQQKGLDAKFLIAQGNRAADNAAIIAVEENKDRFYLEDGAEEELTAIRQQAIQPFLDAIDDEEIRQVAEFSFKESNIVWFKNSYDKPALSYRRADGLNKLFTEINLIEKNNTGLMSEDDKDREIDTLIKQVVKLNPLISYSDVNRAAATILKDRAEDEGAGALFRVMDKGKHLDSANLADTKADIIKGHEEHNKNKKPEIIKETVSQILSIHDDKKIAPSKRKEAYNDIINNVLQANPFIKRAELLEAVADQADEMLDRDAVTDTIFEFMLEDEEAKNNPVVRTHLDTANRTFENNKARIQSDKKQAEEKAQQLAEKQRKEAQKIASDRTHSNDVARATGRAVDIIISGNVVAGTGIKVPRTDDPTKTTEITTDMLVAEYSKQSAEKLQVTIEAITNTEMSPEEKAKEIERATQIHLLKEMDEFYKPMGVIPPSLANPILNNAGLFSASLVSDEDSATQAKQVLTAYRAIKATGSSVKLLGIDTEFEYRLKALDFLTTEGNVDVVTATKMLKSERNPVAVGEIDFEKVAEGAYENVVNQGKINAYLKEGIEYYMSFGNFTKEQAQRIMAEKAADDFLITTDSLGNQRAIKVLSKDLAGNSQNIVVAQDFINEFNKSDFVQEVSRKIQGVQEGEEVEELAIYLSNHSTNPNLVSLRLATADNVMEIDLLDIPISKLQDAVQNQRIDRLLQEIQTQYDIDAEIVTKVEQQAKALGISVEEYRRRFPLSNQ